MLHDTLCAALRVPTGSGASLLPAADLCRPPGRQLRGPQPGHVCGADTREPGPGYRRRAEDRQQAELIGPD
jgi:hypothetical protein